MMSQFEELGEKEDYQEVRYYCDIVLVISILLTVANPFLGN